MMRQGGKVLVLLETPKKMGYILNCNELQRTSMEKQ